MFESMHRISKLLLSAMTQVTTIEHTSLKGRSSATDSSLHESIVVGMPGLSHTRQNIKGPSRHAKQWLNPPPFTRYAMQMQLIREGIAGWERASCVEQLLGFEVRPFLCISSLTITLLSQPPLKGESRRDQRVIEVNRPKMRSKEGIDE